VADGEGTDGKFNYAFTGVARRTADDFQPEVD
jgi:hypothetical protein